MQTVTFSVSIIHLLQNFERLNGDAKLAARVRKRLMVQVAPLVAAFPGLATPPHPLPPHFSGQHPPHSPLLHAASPLAKVYPRSERH